MATRGTQFGRTMAYFRDCDLDEARAALSRASQIVSARETKVVNPPQRWARKARSNAQETQPSVNEAPQRM